MARDSSHSETTPSVAPVRRSNQGDKKAVPCMLLKRNPLRELRRCRARLYDALGGYYITAEELDHACRTYIEYILKCPKIPIAELLECLSIFEAQLPSSLAEQMDCAASRLEQFISDSDNSPTEAERSASCVRTQRPSFKDKPADSGGDGVRTRLQVIEERTTLLHGQDPDYGLRSYDLLLRDTMQELHFAFRREVSEEGCADEAQIQARRSLRIVLSGVEDLLHKYCQGYVMAAINDIREMMSHYLEVEELFHSSDMDSAALVLHSKRPEYDPEQLLMFARSHKALKLTNRLMSNLLEAIKHHPELMEQAKQFEVHLRRMAALSKIDYSALAHEARQLLLTRRDKTFHQKTQELIETLWDVLESYTVQQMPSGPTSPVTFGGRLWSTYFPSPTPGSGGVVSATAQSVGSHSCASGGSSMAGYGQPQNNWGYLTAMSLSSCALDLSRFPTDSLVAILGHHNTKMKKLALSILVMRTFGIRQGKIHDFRVRAQGETWNATTLSHSLSNNPNFNPSPHNHNLYTKTPTWNIFDPDVYPVVQGGDQRQKASASKPLKSRTFSPSPRQKQPGSRSPESAKEINGKLLIPNLVSSANLEFTSNNPSNGSVTVPADYNRNAHNFEAYKRAETTQTLGSRKDSNIPPSSFNGGLQDINSLIAIWTHEAVFSYDFLTSECDPLHPEIAEQSPMTCTISSSADPRFGLGNADGSMTSRIEASGASNALASRYVAAGSRLHHMLSAFAGTLDDPQGAAGKSQQTTAFLLESCVDFENKFHSCLCEISELQPFLPSAPPAVDGKILLCVILDVPIHKSETDADGGHTEPRFEPSHTTLATIINKNIEILEDLNFNLMWFAFLGGDSSTTTQIDPTKARYAAQDILGLKCFYFRNLHALPPTPNVSHPRNDDKSDPSMSDTFSEVSLLRNCEIPLFQFLELRRLRHFYVTKHPTSASNVHLFEAVPKGKSKHDAPTPRFFVRIITNVTDPLTSELGLFEQERCFVGGLNALELSLRESLTSSSRPVGNHHILMTVVYIPPTTNHKGSVSNTHASVARASPAVTAGGTVKDNDETPHAYDNLKLTPSAAEQIARDLYERYSQRIQKLGASVIEVRFKTKGWQFLGHMQGSPSLTEGVYPYRIVLDNPSGQTLRARRFVEIQNPSTGERVFAALDSADSLSTLILKSSSAFDYAVVPGDRAPMPSVSPVAPLRPPTLIPKQPNPTMTVISVDPTSLLSMLSSRDRRELHDYDGKPVDIPHPWAGPLESKRVQAAALQTLYIYDFIDLLEVAVKNMWRRCPKYLFGGAADDLSGGQAADCGQSEPKAAPSRQNSIDHSLIPTATTLVPDRVVEAVEVALNKNGDFVELSRSPGQNECGMVAWRVLLRTPEFPKGRRIILIGNDVTTLMGTFGVQEDLLFQRASELARVQGIPRVYIAVNSGARMGLATEVQQAFKVEWIDPDSPNK
eukprot:Blabericola_migrator_1__1576@NODE_1419_length_4583_cov_173_858503_g46_i1_p1_GENE_NODE_1419_length_4583_cov_173_858503_g46_i1NODE_1419_length_4583_cov_173_858503_g46_i1_p1_ORF_typecomplete_len1451_score223_33ACC_central/PF08326_12/9_1e38Carboxyl_trans/PF01039_22/0_0033_NODE_1419_length_4583_cov_173_858503_g46_i1994451